MITNPSYSTELNSANLVYEQAGDRLAWQIYKFRSGLVPPDRYPYGPYGLRHGEFFNPRERSFMLHPVMHVWSKTVTPLTVETLLELFQEAVNLGPRTPAPASGELRPAGQAPRIVKVRRYGGQGRAEAGSAPPTGDAAQASPSNDVQFGTDPLGYRD